MVLDHKKLFRYAILAPCLILCTCQPENKKLPQARAGKLSLSVADIKYAPANLTGQWHFAWQQFITPHRARSFFLESNTTDELDRLINVPAYWNNRLVNQETIQGNGYATYALHIELKDFSKKQISRLALEIPTMHTAYRLFANGDLIAKNGEAGTTQASSRAQYLPQIAQLNLKQNDLFLVLHISNFYHRKGGTWTNIRLGYDADLQKQMHIRWLIDITLLGILLTIFVYHLALYYFLPHSRSTLYLSLFCLVMMLRILTTGEHLLAQVLPDIPFWLYIKLQYFSFYMALPLWALYAHDLFPEEMPRYFMQIATGISALFILYILVTPTQLVTYSIFYFEVITIIGSIIYTISIVLSVWRKKPGSLLVALGWFIFFITILNDILFTQNLIQSIILAHFGLSVFVLLQAVNQGKKFSRSYQLAEELSTNLEERVRQRTLELQKSSNELKIAKNAAEDSNRAKSEFLAVMNHEIRTPLNAILGTAQALKDSPLAGEQMHQIQILNRASTRLLQLVNDTLDLSRIESGNMQSVNQEIDLPAFCNEIVQLIKDQADNQKLHIHLELNARVPTLVRGDLVHLEHILINLMGNAVKFTDEGSVILKLEVDREEADRVWLWFRVSDTGIGIAPNQIQKIFDRFSQADQSPTRRYEGSGLGLSIARSLIELMGGKMEVESALTQGSEFRFLIPLQKILNSKSDSIKRDVTESKSPVLPEGLKILLVDDTEDNRYLVEVLLKKFNINFSMATNGQEAVEHFTSSKFDLILMDMLMPVMDGFQATTAIRTYEEEMNLNRTPIIAFTADATVQTLHRSTEAGCDDHLTKPFRKDDLIRIMMRYLGDR